MALFFLCLFLVIIHSQDIPSWSAPRPNASLPLGGYTQIPSTTNTEIYHGVWPNSSYNHASMIGYYNSTLIVMWKNCQNDEDCNGQKILYSQSIDGKKWTTPQIMFRNLTVSSTKATMFVGPPIMINNKLYAAGSPGLFDSKFNKHTADGSQFCLWPEPLNPRNCGPITGNQYNNTLMMRQVLPGIGNLGKVFWVSSTAPKQFEDATKTYNIPTINEMDSETQKDISLLTKQMNGFCDGSNQKQIDTLKCEVCPNGCQLYSSINSSIPIGNERSHYILPSNDKDVILYRSGEYNIYASIRNISSNNWVGPTSTNIPNQNSNINCGVLPNNKRYLVSNAVVRPKNDSTLSELNFRDPVTIATSMDGYDFNMVGVVMSCTNLSATSTCQPRNPGGGKNPGPSYPQAITIIDPAPVEMQGLYVVATNNKEDVWISHMPFDVIP